MTIDAYVAALERLLPVCARLRAVSEVRDHLRDAAAAHRAAGLSAQEAEVAATTAFGPVEEVARRIGSEVAVRESRLAGLLAFAAALFFVFPLYVVPENTLPPATWAEKPRDIALLQIVALGFWLSACLVAAVAAALAWTRWSRFAAPLLVCACLGVAGATAASAALVVRWFSYTPATPNWAFAAPLAAVCLVACAGAAVWARSSRNRLDLAD